MKRYEARQKAAPGFYWNTEEWEITVISGEAGELPGEPGTRFVKVPALAMLVAGPLMGALYVMFLPFIGFAMLFHHLWEKARSRSHAPVALPEAHLATASGPVDVPAKPLEGAERRNGAEAAEDRTKSTR